MIQQVTDGAANRKGAGGCPKQCCTEEGARKGEKGRGPRPHKGPTVRGPRTREGAGRLLYPSPSHRPEACADHVQTKCIPRPSPHSPPNSAPAVWPHGSVHQLDESIDSLSVQNCRNVIGLSVVYLSVQSDARIGHRQRTLSKASGPPAVTSVSELYAHIVLSVRYWTCDPR